MEVDAEKDGVEQTATVGIVFDVRFKLHENLADKPYLDTTDRSGKSLRQKAEDRNRFAHNRRGNSVSNDRNRYGSRDGSSGWGNKDSYSEKYKSSSNREGERGRKARSNRDDGYNQEVIELGPWGGGTISQRESEGGGDWMISTEPSQQNYQDGWGESRRPRNETSRRRDEENGWSVVHMDPEVNNHTGAVGNEAQYEDSARISSICDILRAADVLGKMKFVEAKMATEEQLLLVHSEEYLKIIKSTKNMEESRLLDTGYKFDQVYFNRNTYMCARLAAGSVIELCKEVAMNKLDSGIALIRPPGHHAQREKAKGYCIFNNIAIAVQELRRLKLAEKIMIVDWDIHHGNGIQEVFLEDPDVLYFSIHRHENGGFYPCSPDADTSVVGRNAGIGRNVNVAFERSGMNDGDYLHIFERLLLPMSKEFNPDFIIVACGFDAAQGDPVGKCYVTPECFSIMATLVLNMANNGMGGRTAFVLEGGHDREASAYSALACIKAMLWIPFEDGPIVPKAVQKIARDPSSSRESSLGVPKDQHNKPNVGPQRPTDEPPKQELTKVLERYSYLPFLEDYHASKSGKAVVDRVISYHRQYWKCLQS